MTKGTRTSCWRVAWLQTSCCQKTTDFLSLEDHCVLPCGFSRRSLTTTQIPLQQPFAVFVVSWVRWCVGPRPRVEVSSWTFLCLEALSLKPLSNQMTRDQGLSCWGGPGRACVSSTGPPSRARTPGAKTETLAKWTLCPTVVTFKLGVGKVSLGPWFQVEAKSVNVCSPASMWDSGQKEIVIPAFYLFYFLKNHFTFRLQKYRKDSTKISCKPHSPFSLLYLTSVWYICYSYRSSSDW